MSGEARQSVPLPEAAEGRAGKGPVKILVVDDERGIRDMLCNELGAAGYEVAKAADGAAALELMRGERFEVAICDINMPRMDGLKTLETMKKMDPDMEVIMATGYGSVETAVTAMKMGAYDYLQKPFHLSEMFALVRKALEKSDLRAVVGVYEASKAVFDSLDLGVLLPTICRIGKDVLRADDVSIMLEEDDGTLRLAASAGLEGVVKESARLSLGERVAGRAAQWKQPLLIVGPLEKDPRFADVPSLRDVKSSIVYPLAIGGQVLGVLTFNRLRQEVPFSAPDLRNATIIGSQIAQAVYNAKLYRQLESRMAQLETAYRDLEETKNQLVQSEKLAAIGQLAAGVAHELNNPLTGIMGFAQLLLQEEGLSGQQKEDLEGIYKQSQRCRQIIQNLLQFSHRKEPKREPTQMVSLVESTLRLVRYDLVTSGVSVVHEAAEGLPRISADPNQLQQVFLNLLTNARQALEGRKDGRIVIKSEADGERVRVTFQDNGCGIPAEHINKVFDPFFTTKPVGKGTGLGLSISYGIVQQHGGTLRVESEPGQGTRFILEFPAMLP